MTDLEQYLQQAKERAEKATELPWPDSYELSLIYKDRLIVSKSEDIDFIAHARADVPALVDLVHSLKISLEDMAAMPEHDQDDAHRLRHKAKHALAEADAIAKRAREGQG